MHAAWYLRNGEARDVLVVGELPTPSPAAGEVRVKLVTSGVNPSDIRFRRQRPMTGELVVPHSDGAGVIDAVGDGVPAGRVGERVWIWNAQWQRTMGTAAEYVAIPAERAVPLPANVDFAAGACLGIPAMTGYQAVRMAGDIAGKTVLVIGASSSVGFYAAQVAAARGARVIGTVGSADKARHARTGGVEATIDYKTESVGDRIKELTAGKGADVIIDMDLSTTVELLRNGGLAQHGTLVSYGSNVPGDIPFPVEALRANLYKLLFLGVFRLTPEDRRAVIDGLNEMSAAGALTHVIGARFSLDQIVAAHEAVEHGKLIGNVIVDIAR
ncbi:MAG TPA: NADPH:quinone reductase [Ramlibacter sp.]|nr:NADPH:quinone reductase [Ramlibacter sp.]